MKKNQVELTAVRALYQAGKLEEAKAGYLAILRKNPQELEALHSLAILFARQENFSQAIHYLKIAVALQPNNPTLRLHLANMHKMQGGYTEATQLLKDTITFFPDYVPALNNLGTIYFAEGEINNAILTYQAAIAKQPDYIDAYYNLGLAFRKQSNDEEAIKTYQHLLEIAPDHFAARFQFACTLMNQENFSSALQHFLLIEKAESNHFETQTNLASCYLKMGNLKEATLHYLKALELRHDDKQILFNLGVIAMQQDNIDQAIQYYQKAVAVDEDFFPALHNLGSAFLAKQHPAFALPYFQQAQRLQPDNEAISYIVKMLAQNQPVSSAPNEYVTSLFDAYADHYEPHLLNALDYQLPSLIQKALVSLEKIPLAAKDILDLGCGTGLCGVPLKPFAKSLTGVDLSEKMLAVAQQKNIYDSLIHADLVKFITEKKAAYDLIIAGDVLVYMGDLTRLFQLITQALRINGFFIFNTEIGREENYKMHQSGRFRHEKNYLEHLAQENHLSIRYYQVVVTRQQNNEPVQGHLFVLQKDEL